MTSNSLPPTKLAPKLGVGLKSMSPDSEADAARRLSGDDAGRVKLRLEDTRDGMKRSPSPSSIITLFVGEEGTEDEDDTIGLDRLPLIGDEMPVIIPHLRGDELRNEDTMLPLVLLEYPVR